MWTCTNDHLRQRLPNRRFRRLLPAAVAAVTLAASAPFAAAAPAHAQTRTPPKVAVARPGKIPTLPRASTARGERCNPTAGPRAQSPRLRSVGGDSTGGPPSRRAVGGFSVRR